MVTACIPAGKRAGSSRVPSAGARWLAGRSQTCSEKQLQGSVEDATWVGASLCRLCGEHARRLKQRLLTVRIRLDWPVGDKRAVASSVRRSARPALTLDTPERPCRRPAQGQRRAGGSWEGDARQGGRRSRPSWQSGCEPARTVAPPTKHRLGRIISDSSAAHCVGRASFSGGRGRATRPGLRHRSAAPTTGRTGRGARPASRSLSTPVPNPQSG